MRELIMIGGCLATAGAAFLVLLAVGLARASARPAPRPPAGGYRGPLTLDGRPERDPLLNPSRVPALVLAAYAERVESRTVGLVPEAVWPALGALPD